MLVSNDTSEHVVRFDSFRAIKRTLAGHFGQIPFIRDGLVDRRLATPLEYLDRLALQNEVFADDFQIEGVTVSDKPSMILFESAGRPSFVVSQQWIQAANRESPVPSPEEIADYLTARGFTSAPKSYYGWFRRADAVLIVDAKPDNFSKTIAGITPVDLQMSRAQLQELTNLILETSPIIFPV